MRQKPTHREVGGNLLADLSGIQPDLLRDAERLMSVLQSALANAGFHVLREVVHRFDCGGEGITGVVILSESHAAIHSYPEIGYLALDIFSCGPSDGVAVADTLAEVLRPQTIEIHRQARTAMVAHEQPFKPPLVS